MVLFAALCTPRVGACGAARYDQWQVLSTAAGHRRRRPMGAEHQASTRTTGMAARSTVGAATRPPSDLRPEHAAVLELQRTAGNAAVTATLQRVGGGSAVTS